VDREPHTAFSVRDANQAMKGTIRTVDDLLPVLDLVERHHYIRQAAVPKRPGPGRSRSPVYEVNPDALARPIEGNSDGSGNAEPPSGPSDRPAPADVSDRDSEDIKHCETRNADRDHGPPAGRCAEGGSESEPALAAHNSQCPQNSPEGGDVSDPGPATTADNSQYSQNAGGPDAAEERPEQDMEGGALSAGYDGAVLSQTPYLVVRTAGELQSVVNAVAESRTVGVDCETTGLDPQSDRVRLLSLDCETVDGGRFTYLVDCFALDPAPLFGPLADTEVVAHNAAFDLGFLARLGFVPGRVHDTMLLSQVLYAAGWAKGVAPVRHGLKDCCARETGAELTKDLQASDWSGPLTGDQLAYAAADAAVLVPLFRALSAKLKAEGLDRAAAIESAALPCIVWLGSSGVPFDRERWLGLAAAAKADADRLTAELNAAAPPRPGTLFAEPWNWDSPEQVQRALELAGCPVGSTRDGVLAELDHPLARLLRDHREARKRETTYGAGWLDHVAPDGRIYPRWVQLGANSGRMACSSPNMQNLPRGEYRKCVAAPPRRVLVKADYSQIELRIAAKVSGDRALVAAYERGEDLHALTARQVLGIAEVTKEHRQLAKALNFGLLYGMGAKGFRNYARSHYGLELTEHQANEYREAFFRAYPGLRRWHRSMGDGPVDTRTLAGRRARGVHQFNEKLNLPVQGTGADGLKRALALLWQRRGDCPTAVPVLVVHDEVVVECPEGDAGPTAEWLRRAMLDGMAPLVAPVPVEVEVKAGRTWGGD
jgi:DNA polymerase I-like protein with 3'-5' exonuclease and polymerase domains